MNRFGRLGNLRLEEFQRENLSLCDLCGMKPLVDGPACLQIALSDLELDSAIEED